MSVLPTDVSAILSFKNGTKQKQEFHYGSSFLSQQGRFIKINDSVSAIEVFNNTGNIRTLEW